MLDVKNSYRQVIKATTLFGGVQVLNIIIAIIRSKFLAIFIGPIGMGISGLLYTTLNLVNGVTNFGLGRSSVKDISFAYNNSDNNSIERTITILKRLVWFTSIFGAIVMIITSPWLSEIAFKSKEYTVSIIWISIALIFKQLTNSHLAVLQGLRKLKRLAKANLIGNFIGLLVTIPLYYYFRIDAIVPAIIISSLISFIISFYYSNKVNIGVVNISNKDVFNEGKSMLQLGFTLSLSSMITLLGAYLLQIYISAKGGLNEIGFYTAGYVILNSYVGLVFKAMSTDYFPRLSAIFDDIKKLRKAVFEQAYIAVLIIMPIIILFLTFMPFIIRILYTNEFTPIIAMVNWGILGMVFKAVSFSLGYVIIAKGDSKVFIKTAIIFNIVLLSANVIGYYFGGLEGLGISFFIYYIIHLISIAIIVYYLYNLYFDREFYPIFLISVILCIVTFLVTYINDSMIKRSILAVLIVSSLYFSYYMLNKKMDIKELLFKGFKKLKC